MSSVFKVRNKETGKFFAHYDSQMNIRYVHDSERAPVFVSLGQAVNNMKAVAEEIVNHHLYHRNEESEYGIKRSQRVRELIDELSKFEIVEYQITPKQSYEIKDNKIIEILGNRLLGQDQELRQFQGVLAMAQDLASRDINFEAIIKIKDADIFKQAKEMVPTVQPPESTNEKIFAVDDMSYFNLLVLTFGNKITVVTKDEYQNMLTRHIRVLREVFPADE